MTGRCSLTMFGLALLCAALWQTGTSHAQSRAARIIVEIQEAYEQLNYQEADIKARAALHDYQSFSPAQLTEIHKILGLIGFSSGATDQARQQFELALAITPDLQLDPLYVSPKILEFFESIKTERLSREQDIGASDQQIRYVVVEDPRPGAAMRSMVLPGWGQLYKKEKRKGLVLTGLWTAGLIGTAVAHFARNNAEDTYLAETDPARVDARFDDFNRLHKIRNNLALFSAGVWLFSYLDAILRKPPKSNLADADQAWMLAPASQGDGVGVALRVEF